MFNNLIITSNQIIHKLVSVKSKQFISILFVVLMISGCNCNSSESWSQFHGDISNQGYMGVNSAAVVITSERWIKDVGQVGFSSPAIDKDGTIYVTNTMGKLWAWNPSGTLKQQLEFPST